MWYIFKNTFNDLHLSGLCSVPVSGLGSITIDDYNYNYDYMSFLFIDYDYDYDYSSL